MGARAVRTVAVLGNYLPRHCGLATFTSDLTEALARAAPDVHSWAMAMSDRPEGYDYPEPVHFEIQQDSVVDYSQAARFLDQGPADLLCLQHEFGIYGGPAGHHVLDLLRDVRLPVVTTLHTVLREPTPEQRTVMDGLIRRSDRLVVMAERAIEILRDVYQVPIGKIALIPHGIPEVPFLDPNYFKSALGVEGRTVILTFGLLSPGKGIEYMLRALPRIIREHPEVVYVVLGATHPHVLQRDGEAYRDSLHALAGELGVTEHVRFHNRFVPLDELCTYLSASEIYVTPYLGEAQIASGTLAYALGTGNAVVSTPYWCAQELLAEGRGLLAPFRDAEALAARVLALLDDRVEMHAMRKRAYAHTRPMVWREVALRHLELFEEVKRERGLHPRGAARKPVSLAPLPEPAFQHLLALTDDTGLIQHARFTIPQRVHGYCTDDNARALLVTLKAPSSWRPRLREAAARYASFLEHALDPATGRFRNFLTYDRRWIDDAGSEDAHGRALWALGAALEQGDPDWLDAFAGQLFQEALPAVETFTSPRGCALSAIGLHAYLKRFPGDRGVRRAYQGLIRRLHAPLAESRAPGWAWPESLLSYENARLPHALLQAGHFLEEPAVTRDALAMLTWLMDVQSAPEGHFVAVGNHGWFPRGGLRARYDQQPLEAHASLDACLEAWRVTGDVGWRTRAEACFAWFLGANDGNAVLADVTTGGCRDGLHGEGANQNQGAESTLAWLLSLLAIRALRVDGDRVPVPALVGLLRTVAPSGPHAGGG